MPYKLILATDLDGTFLEGDAPTKNAFYSKLLQLRDQVLLIYTTGRHVSTVQQFCRHGYLPYAHFVIGDHGTHVVDGNTFNPIDSLQNPIIEKWNKANSLLRGLLQGEAGLDLQPIDPPYRVAYYYDPSLLQNETLQKIEEAGYDAILSCDAYLDIVPRGVNKGSTLLHLLDHLHLSHEMAVTAGDSMNDLSLFQTGLRSIAVGNAEPKLVAAIKNLKNVYHSSSHGLQGVIEGLRFYNQDLCF